jgi:hypothetical protein
MKPKNNKVFCLDCERPKMLFETQKKAENFIKFNSTEIESENGYGPKRAYLCSFCGGWHITSMDRFAGKSEKENMLESYLSDKKLDGHIKYLNGLDQALIIAEVNLEIENVLLEKDVQEVKIEIKNQIEYLKTEIETKKLQKDIESRNKCKELKWRLEALYKIRKQKGLLE